MLHNVTKLYSFRGCFIIILRTTGESRGRLRKNRGSPAGDAYAALQLVRGVGVLREHKPGSDDPDLVRRRRVVATARRESRLSKGA